MASDSKRKNALQRMVVLLKTVTPGVTYFRNLSIGNSVTTEMQLYEDQMTEGASFCWVRAGYEQISSLEISPNTAKEGVFEILIDAVVKDDTAESIVEELEDLIHDIQLVVGSDPTLQNSVSYALVTSVDAPVYSLGESMASATVRVTCTIDFESGITI